MQLPPAVDVTTDQTTVTYRGLSLIEDLRGVAGHIGNPVIGDLIVPDKSRSQPEKLLCEETETGDV